MKQPLLLISSNKIFTLALQKALSSDYSVGEISSKTKQNVIVQELKKTLYSKIILVDTGDVETRELLALLVLKMPWLCERTFFLTSIRTANEELFKNTASITVAYYGDIISSTSEISSFCNKLLFMANEKKKIIIESTEILLYPVFFEDVIAAVRAMLSHALDHTLFVFPDHEFTPLTFAKILQRIDPGVTVDISNEIDKKSKKNPYLPNNGKYMVDSLNFETKLKDVYARIPAKTNRPLSKAYSQEKKNGFSPAILFAGISLAALTVFLFLPILAFFSLFSSFLAIEHKKPNIAKGFALFARDAFFISDQTMGSVFGITSFSVGKDTAEGAVLFSDAFSMFTQVAKGNGLSRRELIYGLNLARRVAVIKQQIQTEYDISNIFKKEFGSIAREEQVLMAALDVLPEAAGFTRQKTYLVLFQNNNELRPGGGFIGSYGLLTLKNGKVVGFTIHDVYDADGQMTGHIDPPYALKKYMGTPHWFLRDSNFDVDFTKNAATAAFFLEKETGDRVDGVVGIDASFVKQLLSSIGPIDIPDFQTTITAQNFAFLTQEEIQSHFFPGSRKKKNFLNAVYQRILASVLEENKVSYVGLLTLITNAIDQKHLLITSFNPSVQEVFTANGFSSTLAEKRIVSEDTVRDFVGINEANIGQNKANAYIVRKIYHDVDIQKYNRFSQIQLVYTNKSEDSNIFGGDYDNYLRLILPDNAIITNIAVDGKETEFIVTDNPGSQKDQRSADLFKVERTDELGKAIYGMRVNIPQMTTRVISIAYTIGHNLQSAMKEASYDLIVFKQPGTDADSYSLSLSYPKDFIISKTNKKIGNSGNELSFMTELDEDERLTASFVRK